MLRSWHLGGWRGPRWQAAPAAMLVVCSALLGWPASAAGAVSLGDEASPARSVGVEPEPAVQRIVAIVHDLRHDEATENKLEETLQEQLLQKAREWSGYKIAPQQIVQEMLWLRRQEEVHETRSQTADPLSGRVTLRAELSIPLEVVERWIPQLRERHLRRDRAQLTGLAATAGLWLLTLLATVVTDRLTGGYRRAWLIPGAMLVAAGLTAAGWWYLYQVVLAAPYAG